MEFSYVPSERDRRLELGGPRVAALRSWWVPGALLTLTGAVLAGVGGSSAGWAVLATVAGATLLTVPYVSGERSVRGVVQSMWRERRVTITDAGVRYDVEGGHLAMDWSRVRAVTETAEHWHLSWDTGGDLYLPKSAVPASATAELARLLDLAAR